MNIESVPNSSNQPEIIKGGRPPAKPPKAPGNSPSGNALVNDRVVAASTDQYLSEQDKEFLISISSESPFIPQLTKDRLDNQGKLTMKEMIALLKQLAADPAIAKELHEYLVSTGYSVPQFLAPILNNSYPNGEIPEELRDLIEKIAASQGELDGEDEESTINNQLASLDPATQDDVLSMASFFGAIAAITALIAKIQNEMMMATADILAEYRDVAWDNLEIGEERAEKQIEKLQEQMEKIKEAEKKSKGMFAGMLSGLGVSMIISIIVFAVAVVVTLVTLGSASEITIPVMIIAGAGIIAITASAISAAASTASFISFAATGETMEEQLWSLLPFKVPLWAQILVEVLVQMILAVLTLGAGAAGVVNGIASFSTKAASASIQATLRAIMIAFKAGFKAVMAALMAAIAAVVGTVGVVGLAISQKVFVVTIQAMAKIALEAIKEALLAAAKAIRTLLIALIAAFMKAIKPAINTLKSDIQFAKMLVKAQVDSAKAAVKVYGVTGTARRAAASTGRAALTFADDALTAAQETAKGAGKAITSAPGKLADAMKPANLKAGAISKAKNAQDTLMANRLFTQSADGTIISNNKAQLKIIASSIASQIFYTSTTLTATDRLKTAMVDVGTTFGVPEEIMEMIAEQFIAMMQIIILFAAIFLLAGAGAGGTVATIQTMYKMVLVFQSATQGTTSIFQGISLIKQGQAQEDIGEAQAEVERYKGLLLQGKILEKNFQIGIDKMQDTYEQVAADFKSWGDTLQHMLNAYKSAVNSMTMRA